MKKLLILLLFGLTACSTASITTSKTGANGVSETCTAKYSSAKWSTEGVKLNACGAEGGADSTRSVDPALLKNVLKLLTTP